MGDTPKRMDPEKRGRFNLGDKEAISLALWAEINTAGWNVRFPQKGGREIRRNRRQRGTEVSLMMPWGREEYRRLIDRMKLLRPPAHIRYRVNWVPVPRRPELSARSITLPTVLQSAPGEPIRPTRRRTMLHILEPAGDGSWLYEMGIPIQEISLPYDIDVMQKVPMPPNRDTVSEGYLKEIYTEVLNAMHNEMEASQFTETWTRAAIENPRVEPQAVKTTIQQRYGERVAISSQSRDANARALDENYRVINPRSVSKEELQNMRDLGELKRTADLFPPPDHQDAVPLDIRGDRTKEEFAIWVVAIGKLAGKNVRPVFIDHPGSNMIACCTMNTENPEMRFNIHHLDDQWLAQRGARQLEIVIHELGHAQTNGEMSHGPRWGDGCAQVGAQIAMGMRGGTA